MSKKEEIEKNLLEIEKMVIKGSEDESEEVFQKLLDQQKELIQRLSPENEGDRELLLRIQEKNGEFTQMIEEKKKMILKQSHSLTDSKESQKNYDIYR